MKKTRPFYFNLGLNTPVIKKEVVGIFDIDNATIKKDSRDFLNSREKQRRIEYVGSDIPRSFVLCAEQRSKLYGKRLSKEREQNNEKVYITSLSTQVLAKRSVLKNY